MSAVYANWKTTPYEEHGKPFRFARRLPSDARARWEIERLQMQLCET